MWRLPWKLLFIAYASAALTCHVVNTAKERQTSKNQTTINQYIVSKPAENENESVQDVETSNLSNATETQANSDLRFTLYFIIDGIVNPIMGIVGMLSNILNVIVLTRRRMRSSTNMFLVGLAVADFFVLLTVTMFYIRFMGYYRPAIAPPNSVPDDESFFWWLYWHTWYMVANIFMTASNWLILSVTVYRYIAVCFPIKAQRMCTTSRARIIIALIYLAAFILNLPDFFTVTVTEKTIENVTKPIMDYSFLYLNKSFGVFYYNTKTSLTVFLPWIVCFALTIKLILTLRQSAKDFHHISARSQSTYGRNGKNKKIPDRSDDQKRISRMLILLVIWFLVCQFPEAIHWTLTTVSRETVENDEGFLIFRIVCDLFLVANHASNFFLYAASNQLYRKVLMQIITCRKTRLKKYLATRSGTSTEFRTQMSHMTPNGSRSNSPCIHRSKNSVYNYSSSYYIKTPEKESHSSTSYV